jgi:thiazole tautomerase (transcriptional regulator TenI)
VDGSDCEKRISSVGRDAVTCRTIPGAARSPSSLPLKDVPTVHAVTDPASLASPGFAIKAAEVLHALGPNGAVHLRGHGIPGAELWRLALALVPAQQASGGWLIVNDRLDVARAAGARGGQLGQHALLLRDAQLAAPQLRLGVSVHSAPEAQAAADADWWLAGHIYPTASHPGAAPRGTALLHELAPLGVPVIAIGGITPANAHEARAAGAHGVAAISGIWGATDPARAATEYL